MSDEILESEIVEEGAEEEAQPISIQVLLANLVHDLVNGHSADNVADLFIEDFILVDRPETDQIVQLFEVDNAMLATMLKASLQQDLQVSIQVIDTKGAAYFNALKAAIKQRMTELATEE